MPNYNRLLKNSPFTWFDKLTTGFDKLVLSPSFVRINSAEGLKANGGCIENILDCAARKQGKFSVCAKPSRSTKNPFSTA